MKVHHTDKEPFMDTTLLEQMLEASFAIIHGINSADLQYPRELLCIKLKTSISTKILFYEKKKKKKVKQNRN